MSLGWGFADVRPCRRPWSLPSTKRRTRPIAWEHVVTRFNIEVGEDIRWLPRHHLTARELPNLDFWLFDASWACVLHFDADDVPQKLERLDEPEEIARLFQ